MRRYQAASQLFGNSIAILLQLHVRVKEAAVIQTNRLRIQSAHRLRRRSVPE
jgi:hypothetical protein